MGRALQPYIHVVTIIVGDWRSIRTGCVSLCFVCLCHMKRKQTINKRQQPLTTTVRSAQIFGIYGNPETVRSKHGIQHQCLWAPSQPSECLYRVCRNVVDTSHTGMFCVNNTPWIGQTLNTQNDPTWHRILFGLFRRLSHHCQRNAEQSGKHLRIGFNTEQHSSLKCVRGNLVCL